MLFLSHFKDNSNNNILRIIATTTIIKRRIKLPTYFKLLVFDEQIVCVFHRVILVGEVIFNGLQPLGEPVDLVIHLAALVEELGQPLVLLLGQDHNPLPLLVQGLHLVGNALLEARITLLHKGSREGVDAANILFESFDVFQYTLKLEFKMWRMVLNFGTVFWYFTSTLWNLKLC